MPAKPTVQDELLAACKECMHRLTVLLCADDASPSEDNVRIQSIAKAPIYGARHQVRKAIARAESEVKDGS